MKKPLAIQRVVVSLVLWLTMGVAMAQNPCIKARPWTCFTSIELTFVGETATGTIGMRVFDNGDMLLESRDKQSVVRKALALRHPHTRVLYSGVPDKEIQEGHPFIFFDYGFAAPLQALEMAYPNGLSSVPDKETESRVLLDNEVEATLFATRLPKERIHVRINMPKFALVQDGFVDYAKKSPLPDNFELDGWKDRSLRTYRTIGEARASAP
jgi:hypothetical protein